MKTIDDCVRKNIASMQGYTPGEQPKIPDLVKLNTNENAYPPSDTVCEALRTFDWKTLNRYPDPTADAFRDEAAKRFGVKRENVIAGNGSDDLLTMIFRTFADETRKTAFLDPTYSLYEVLAKMQDSPVIKLELAEDFSFPSDAELEKLKDANLLIITRPNAPTGNAFPLAKMEDVLRNFDGITVFDEAYADFADDNCMELAGRYEKALVMRTFSKSYSLAGLRFGYAVGSAAVIDELMKLKDSYNVDKLAQAVALAAFRDEENMRKNAARIRSTREFLSGEFARRGFAVVPSQSNFLFVSPPDRNGKHYFEKLREQAVLVRYFPAERTAEFVRITIGDDRETARLLEATGNIYPEP